MIKKTKNKGVSAHENKAVGNTQLKYQRERAKKELTKAKIMEEEKKKKGWAWIKKGNECRLVSASKLKDYLAKGYYPISQP